VSEIDALTRQLERTEQAWMDALVELADTREALRAAEAKLAGAER
jgi:hypothetical protein